MLTKPIGVPPWATAPTPLPADEFQTAFDKLSANIAQRKAASIKRAIALRLDELAHDFQLTPMEVISR